MATLNELNEAIDALNKLFEVCTDDDKCNSIAEKRNQLDDQAGELANKTLQDDIDGLPETLDSLTILTHSANKTKNEINDVKKKIDNLNKTISDAEEAITKVGAILALL